MSLVYRLPSFFVHGSSKKERSKEVKYGTKRKNLTDDTIIFMVVAPNIHVLLLCWMSTMKTGSKPK